MPSNNVQLTTGLDLVKRWLKQVYRACGDNLKTTLQSTNKKEELKELKEITKKAIDLCDANDADLTEGTTTVTMKNQSNAGKADASSSFNQWKVYPLRLGDKELVSSLLQQVQKEKKHFGSIGIRIFGVLFSCLTFIFQK